jgi:RND family efflux transporter MFP subunit
MNRIVPFGFLLAALAVAAVSGCGGHDGATGSGSRGAANAAAAAESVALGESDVFVVEKTDLAVGVPVSGALAPRHDVAITSPFAGEVLDAVLVDEGQRVRRGQVLARFRTLVASPAAASAEAAYRIATTDYQRMKNLFEKGAASQADLDNAEATMRSAEANRASANQRLAETSVRAPIDGVIARRDVQSGDRVGDGDPMFRLVNTSELEFQATVPAEYARRVKVGATVSLSVSGIAAGPIEGRVDRVNAVADAATRQVRVYVIVPNRDGRLAGDLFASGNLLLERARGVVAVPPAAVRRDASGASFVWVANGGTIARRDVTTGLADEGADRVEVLSGLAAGDVAIVGPIEGLTDGQPVALPAKER